MGYCGRQFTRRDHTLLFNHFFQQHILFDQPACGICRDIDSVEQHVSLGHILLQGFIPEHKQRILRGGSCLDRHAYTSAKRPQIAQITQVTE